METRTTSLLVSLKSEYRVTYFVCNPLLPCGTLIYGSEQQHKKHPQQGNQAFRKPTISPQQSRTLPITGISSSPSIYVKPFRDCSFIFITKAEAVRNYYKDRNQLKMSAIDKKYKDIINNVHAR